MLTAPVKEMITDHCVSDLPLLSVLTGSTFYIAGMAGAIHFLSDVLVPETSRFPAFELGSSQRDKKVQKDY